MQALIISIGTEILMGEIIDTNSHFISKQLPLFGITSNQVMQIGDDKKSLSNSIKEALNNYDIIFLTGGLGPTQDDITREAIGEALKEDITISEPLVKTLKEHFSKRNMIYKSSYKSPLANKSEVNKFLSYIICGLDKKGFLQPDHKRQSMIRNINNIFHRLNLSEQEIRILLGIFSTLNEFNRKS